MRERVRRLLALGGSSETPPPIYALEWNQSTGATEIEVKEITKEEIEE